MNRAQPWTRVPRPPATTTRAGVLSERKKLAERGEKAQAGVPHLQEAPAVEVQELPARRVQAVLPPPLVAATARSAYPAGRRRSSRQHGARWRFPHSHRRPGVLTAGGRKSKAASHGIWPRHPGGRWRPATWVVPRVMALIPTGRAHQAADSTPGMAATGPQPDGGCPSAQDLRLLLGRARAAILYCLAKTLLHVLSSSWPRWPARSIAVRR